MIRDKQAGAYKKADARTGGDDGGTRANEADPPANDAHTRPDEAETRANAAGARSDEADMGPDEADTHSNSARTRGDDIDTRPSRAGTREDDARSAYERADAAAVDPRCVPQSLDGHPPIGDEIEYPGYPDEDHARWSMLVKRQMNLLPGRASEAFLRGVELLGLDDEKIPPLSRLSRVLERATGWQIARIPGLLHERDFFNLLSERTFPSTDYIRGLDELDYTPAPDLFHDIFGHMPMLTQPAFADFYQMFGRAALNARGADRQRLERFHWFTVEFGLIRQEDGIRIFGAGILSSKNEVTHALSDAVTLSDFDAEVVVEQDYDVWRLQDRLFVLDSFDSLVENFQTWAAGRQLL